MDQFTFHYGTPTLISGIWGWKLEDDRSANRIEPGLNARNCRLAWLYILAVKANHFQFQRIRVNQITTIIKFKHLNIAGVTDTSKLNPKLICPFFDIFFPYLPEKWRKPLRFGVRHGEVSTLYCVFKVMNLCQI